MSEKRKALNRQTNIRRKMELEPSWKPEELETIRAARKRGEELREMVGRRVSQPSGDPRGYTGTLRVRRGA